MEETKWLAAVRLLIATAWHCARAVAQRRARVSTYSHTRRHAGSLSSSRGGQKEKRQFFLSQRKKRRAADDQEDKKTATDDDDDAASSWRETASRCLESVFATDAPLASTQFFSSSKVPSLVGAGALLARLGPDVAGGGQRPTTGRDLPFRWCLRAVETSLERLCDDGECSGEPRDLCESVELSKVQIGHLKRLSYEERTKRKSRKLYVGG